MDRSTQLVRRGADTDEQGRTQVPWHEVNSHDGPSRQGRRVR